jgi:hypothetical protein
MMPFKNGKPPQKKIKLESINRRYLSPGKVNENPKSS